MHSISLVIILLPAFIYAIDFKFLLSIRRYGNNLLYELHPFFALFQLCPDWLPDGHMITFSSSTTGLCIALCNLSVSLFESPFPATSAIDLLNFAISLFPKTSQHYQLLILTLNKVKFSHKTISGQSGDSEAALIKTISRSTHYALTSRDSSTPPDGDMYISSKEMEASALYNSAQFDLPNAPSQAVDKLLSLILHCQTYKLQEYLVKSHILLAETQIVLKLYSQALHTIESVFILALSSPNNLTQSAARWVYVQAKLANCLQSERYVTFKRVEKHLQDAHDGFLIVVHVRFVREILYFWARLYDEFGMKDERNNCAKKFREFNNNATLLNMP